MHRARLSVGTTAIARAVCAALLFGAAAPISRILLSTLTHWQLAGLLYLGSGLGLTIFRIGKRRVVPRRQELGWLTGVILTGGIAAPLLLLFGLSRMTASDASLLLNTESVFTVLLAAWVFKEHVGGRLALGMGAIALGAVILGWTGDATWSGVWPTLAILGACLCWAIDNNLSRHLAHLDATWVAATKGWVAGLVNLSIATSFGSAWSSPASMAIAMITGFFTYGVSLALFVSAIRDLGVARTSAYFSVAPFFGAALALLIGDTVDAQLLMAAALMALGLWLHVSEVHAHSHAHRAMEHEHEHIHDSHHQHLHDADAKGNHSHLHEHEPKTHSHPHYPDIHHRHDH